MRRLLRSSSLLALAALTAGATAVPSPAGQTTGRARTEALARRASDRIRALHREADALLKQERTLLVELRRLEVDRQLKQAELDAATTELTGAEQQLAATTRQLADLEQASDAQRPMVQNRLVQLYKLGPARYGRMLLEVEDFRRLGRVYRMVAELAQLDRRRIADHRRTLDAVRTERIRLTERRKRAVDLQARARTARTELDRAVASHERLVRTIDERRDLNAQLTGELQQAQVRLQASLGGLSSESPVLPLRPFRGELDWPVAGRLTSGFGRQRQTASGTTIVRNGVELATAEGQPVRAVHDGQVAFADGFTGFGNLVILDHGNQSFTLYGYLGNVAVARGSTVDRNAIVGTVGRSPTGVPSLYFELRIDGKPVDPLQWLRALREAP